MHCSKETMAMFLACGLRVHTEFDSWESGEIKMAMHSMEAAQADLADAQAEALRLCADATYWKLVALDE